MQPSALYAERLAAGALKADEAQAAVVPVLDRLCADLAAYAGRKAGWLEKLFPPKSCPMPVRGLYLYGPVGRGKSMLMDLLFECAPVEKKRRVHFHAFMLDLHRALHEGRQLKSQHMDEALPAYAKKIARDVQLLCFDEFHVVDVADAMLLGRLFGALWDLGVVTVATSNWPPDDLYKDGLQRDRFLPFIARLKNQLTLAPILSPTDYRLQRLLGHQVYFAPLGPHSDREMQKLFNELVDDAECQPMEIQLPGRRWVIRRAAKGVVWLDFDEACGEARGASDYLALAEAAQVVFLAHVPQFTAEQRNEAKRLMNLVDILYEGRVRLVMAAAAPPHDLYPAGSHKFEFERTVSRLLEMQSAGYLAGVIGGTDGS